MKEYRININGGNDFIVISSEMLTMLISRIRDSESCELSVQAEELIPAQFSEYLVNVINSNRYHHICFRYESIMEGPISKYQVYQIVQEQLSKLIMEHQFCFEKVQLDNNIKDTRRFNMECSKPFFCACKDSSSAVFMYTYVTVHFSGTVPVPNPHSEHEMHNRNRKETP